MIFALLARWGVPQRLIAPLLGLVAVLALVGCVAFAIHLHTKHAIDKHEAEISAHVIAATAAANAAADAKDAKRQVENARADQSTREAISHAQIANPDAAQASSGPVTAAALRSLRERQAKARAAAR